MNARGIDSAPFAVQAFLISPFVVMLSIGTMLIHREGGGNHLAGTIVYPLAVLWYVWARISTYHALTDAGWLRSSAVVCVTFLASTVLLVGVGALLFF
jgi:hypothetical protein